MYRKLLYPSLGLALAAVVYGCSAEAPVAPDLDSPLFGKTQDHKVNICHLTGSAMLYAQVDGTKELVGEIAVGHQITVSTRAASAHYRHGDPEALLVIDSRCVGVAALAAFGARVVPLDALIIINN